MKKGSTIKSTGANNTGAFPKKALLPDLSTAPGYQYPLCEKGKSMKSIFFAVSIIVLALLSSPSFTQAETFECSFIQEKYPSGKPNAASCSMLPEEVYSSRWYTPEKTQHCKIDSVYSYEDLTDFLVDTNMKKAQWVVDFGLTEDAKTTQKAYYIKEGFSKEEAENRVNVKKKTEVYTRIVSHNISKTRIYIDEITGKSLDPPKEIPEHNMILSNINSTYLLYLPEASGHAILMEPTGMADSSWVQIRFGKCRKLK
ncbi:MAG: hypothetical protein KAT62_12230 [Desulfuromonadales bacterium]|nr:hypothetical protein [Desulfuromonadales bacterium]